MPKDLGSIPRSQPLFMLFFNRLSNALQIKRPTMYHQDLAIQLTSTPDQRATLGGPPYAPGQRMHWIRESQNGS